jgi:hypothetical protein
LDQIAIQMLRGLVEHFKSELDDPRLTILAIRKHPILLVLRASKKSFEILKVKFNCGELFMVVVSGEESIFLQVDSIEQGLLDGEDVNFEGEIAKKITVYGRKKFILPAPEEQKQREKYNKQVQFVWKGLTRFFHGNRLKVALIAFMCMMISFGIYLDFIIKSPCIEIAWYIDEDEDGFGVESLNSIKSCTKPENKYVANFSDCNDFDKNITEKLWYIDEDEDGFGSKSTSNSPTVQNPLKSCTKPDGPQPYVDNFLDCHDYDKNITEKLWYLDKDEDGFGRSTSLISNCFKPTPAPEGDYVEKKDDCNDNEEKAYPGQTEYFMPTSYGFYDYNCNESPEFQTLEIGSCVTQPTPCDLLPNKNGWVTSPLKCGDRRKYIYNCTRTGTTCKEDSSERYAKCH